MEGKSTRLALANGRLELEKELICGGIINLPIVVFWKANWFNDFTLVNKYSSNKSPNMLFPRNTVPRGVIAPSGLHLDRIRIAEILSLKGLMSINILQVLPFARHLDI